jgi:hypothetical protein
MQLLLRDASTTEPLTTWRRWAVRSDGRRHPDHLVWSSNASVGAGDVVVLDHAGPASSRWSLERAVGVDITTDPLSSRRSLALDDHAWNELVAAYAAAAAAVRAQGATVVIAVDDDGLLHAALSPLASAPPRPDRVLEVLQACAPCDVLLVVEDLAPQGIDPTAGVAFAARAIAAAHSRALYATAGTAWLPPLRDRRKGRSVDDVGFDLCSAAWAVGRVGVPVFAIVRAAAPAAMLELSAKRLGLAGVVHDERSTTLTTAIAPTVQDPFESR